MMRPENRPVDIAELWRMLDLITPMALRVAATLRIADLIAEGHTELTELSARAGVHSDALSRLLRYLIVRGVFTEPSPNKFALNDLAALLLDEHPSASRRWMDLEGFGGRMDLAFFDLLTTVRAGRPPETDDKANLSDAVAASFDALMESQSRAQAPAIVAAYEWAGVSHVVDVGGGTGTLLAELLRTHPRVQGTLLELPSTAEAGRRLLAETGLANRCEVVEGDLFEVMPKHAQVYLLKFVLHGIADTDAVKTLQRCREAGLPDSRIVVIERTVGPEDDRDQFTSMDMRMLILGHGRERTLDEYAALGNQADLMLGTVTPTTVGVHLIEFRGRNLP